jgi:hypothetical protein
MYCAVAAASNHELSPATATELREIDLDIFHSVQLIVILIIGVTWGARGDNPPPQYFFYLRLGFWLLS